MLISLGLSALIFLAFHLLGERGTASRRCGDGPLLSAWGRNPLLLYLLHGFLLGIFVLPPIPAWYVDAPLWLVGLQAAGLMAVLSWVGWYLDRRQWYFTL